MASTRETILTMTEGHSSVKMMVSGVIAERVKDLTLSFVDIDDGNGKICEDLSRLRESSVERLSFYFGTKRYTKANYIPKLEELLVTLGKKIQSIELFFREPYTSERVSYMEDLSMVTGLNTSFFHGLPEIIDKANNLKNVSLISKVYCSSLEKTMRVILAHDNIKRFHFDFSDIIVYSQDDKMVRISKVLSEKNFEVLSLRTINRTSLREKFLDTTSISSSIIKVNGEVIYRKDPNPGSEMLMV